MSAPRPRRKLPKGRTYEQVLRHYEVEKAIADRLKSLGRDERERLYGTMYDELFEKVPDHPRLVAQHDPRETAKRNEEKLRLVEKHVGPESVFAEFGPGDCAFARFMCARVAQVYAFDISPQSLDTDTKPPANYRFLCYNGYDLDLPDGLFDVAFSDQLVEHIHPDDFRRHLGLVHRLLKPGGCYIVRTPHGFHGPHDVSRYFSKVPRGFHLKEYTYTEMDDLFRSCGFASCVCHTYRRRRYSPAQAGSVRTVEAWLAPLPYGVRRTLAKLFLPRQMLVVGGKRS